MASKYWLKLFHETIYDPKVMMMSPGARLRFYESLCLAGDYDKDGELPPIEHMMFVFRISREQLLDELNELVKSEMVIQDGDKFIIKNWTKRQVAMDSAERTNRFRDTKHKEEYRKVVTNANEICNESETNRYTDIDIDIEVDVDKEEKREEVDVDNNDSTSLISEFESISKLQAPRDSADWTVSLQAMRNKGITNQIMAQAVSELSEKNYKITGPKSIEQACAIILAKMKMKREVSPRIDEFAEYVRH